MKTYNERLEDAKLLMRSIVRGFDFLAEKNSPENKVMVEFLKHDMEQLRAFSTSRGKRSNGGQECDNDDGPCACGAWHKPETISAEQLIDPEAEVVRLRKLLYGDR